MPPLAIAAVGVAASVGGTIAAGIGSKKSADTANANAKAQDDYSNDVYDIKVNYQHQLQSAEQDSWKTDLDFATRTLNYQATEFNRQEGYIQNAASADLQNENAGVAQEMLKSVQEGIATSLQESDVQQKTNLGTATAQAQADAQGVTGNSINAILQSVQKQGGDAITVLEMNRSAQSQQARVDLEAVKAQGDTQLSALGGNIHTYSPSTPVTTPAPLAPVVKGEDAPTVATPSLLGTVFGPWVTSQAARQSSP